MNIKELLDYTGQRLQVERFKDYCPNGLQVEGRSEIHFLVSGVTASLELIEAAAEKGADAILVHHGWFWRSEDVRMLGTKRKRMKAMLDRDLNLIAYHLPLDAHPEFGNNAQLAKRLGFVTEGWFGEQKIATYGQLLQPATLASLCIKIGTSLSRTPLMLGDPQQMIRRIAWCSGAAQDYMTSAIELGVDAYLTGEISEQTVHLARESGVAFIAAGHHATERYGVQALGSHLAEVFGIRHEFIDVDNPV